MRKDLLWKKGRVDKTFNIKIKTEYIEPSYSISTDTERNMQDTGLLEVFEIYSSNSDDPEFIGRWDQNKQLLDIDIKNIDDTQKLNWRKKKKGYIGHHTTLIKPENRTFSIHIEIMGRIFFTGEVFFNVNHRVKLGTGKFKLDIF